MRTGARILLLLAATALSLLLAEGLVRALDLPPSPLEPLHVGSYRLSDNPILRYTYAPNLPPDHAAYDPMHRGLATNALGFRDRAFRVPKPPGVFRILALGDSATAALGVPELRNTWPKLLERRLRAVRDDPVEVLNLGVGGYDPLQEAELLRETGLALEPDLVLVLLTLNDLESGTDGGVYEALLRARDHLEPASGDPWHWLRRHSRLLFFAEHRLRGSLVERGSRRSPERASPSNPLDEGLRAIRALGREHGFRWMVFLLPGLDGPYARYAHRDLHRRMAAIAEDVGEVEFIDLLEDLRAVEPNLRLLSYDGLHPNRVGQRAVAERIFLHLRGRGAA